MTQIVLDAEAFKALSSDTRLQILKALDARRLTVSELGRLLNLNKATVFEHLKQLSVADLVKKEDEGRKWVYYRLTWKGRNVLHPENVQFMLLLGTGALSVGGLLAQLGSMLSWWGGPTAKHETSEQPTATNENALVADRAASPEPEQASDASGAPSGAGASQPPPSSTESDPGLGFHQDPDAAPVPAVEDPVLWWQTPDWWLVALLGTLLLATAWFVLEYLRAQRRERRALARRIAALPPEPAQAAQND